MPAGIAYDPLTHETKVLKMPTSAAVAANTPAGWVYIETDLSEREFRRDYFGEPMEDEA